MSRPVLVTGAGGFIGARVEAALRDRGTPVRSWAHRQPDLRDAGARESMVEGVGAVVHCAAELAPDATEADVSSINHHATLSLAEAAAAAGADHFVFLSSQAAIGWRADAGLVDETTPCAPSTAYGRSKRAAEEGLARAELGACAWSALRPPTVYGAEERRNFLLLARAATLGVLPLPGGGHNRMSFCHVENLVDAILHVLSVRLTGLVHVADREPVSLRRALRTISRAAGRPSLPLSVPLRWTYGVADAVEALSAQFGIAPPLSRSRVGTLTADCALDIRRLLESGWTPPVSFDEGIQESVGAFQRAGLLVASRRR